LDVQGLSPDTDVKSLLLESPICTIKSISSMLNVLSSPKGFTVTLPVISGYPMVYTLEAYRLLLNRFDGAVVQWHSPDVQRPAIALEVAVEGLRNGERDRYLLDTLITSELGAGYLIQSWLFHDTYHVFLSDPVAVDRVLGLSISFGGLQFDLLYRLAMRRLRRALPPSGGKHVELRHPNGCQRYSLCLGDAMALEKDLYIIVTCYLTPAELNSFGPLSAEYYEDDEPHHVPQPSAAIPTLMWQVHNALYEGEWAQFEELIVQCNKLLNEAPLKEYAATWKRCPDLMVTHQMQNLYRRCIAQHLHTLRRNTSISGYSKKTLSYGAINSGLASRIFSHLNITKASTFWDLGCGSGSVLVQASLETGCKCFGVELLPCRAKIAEAVVEEFESACKLWVLQAGKIIIMVGDLLSEQFWLGLIDAGDAILINNLVFEATLNHEIWKRLGSLKAGATVVALEPFYEGHKRNGGSCVEFSVEEVQYDPGDVSWHAYGGSYYIYRKRMEAK
jgi:H3 lysine-79-specific histone-lysine N-methyltransferase